MASLRSLCSCHCRAPVHRRNAASQHCTLRFAAPTRCETAIPMCAERARGGIGQAIDCARTGQARAGAAVSARGGEMPKLRISRRRLLQGSAAAAAMPAAFATRVLAQAPAAEAITPALVEAARKEGRLAF